MGPAAFDVGNTCRRTGSPRPRASASECASTHIPSCETRRTLGVFRRESCLALYVSGDDCRTGRVSRQWHDASAAVALRFSPVFERETVRVVLSLWTPGYSAQFGMGQCKHQLIVLE